MKFYCNFHKFTVFFSLRSSVSQVYADLHVFQVLKVEYRWFQLADKWWRMWVASTLLIVSLSEYWERKVNGKVLKWNACESVIHSQCSIFYNHFQWN